MRWKQLHCFRWTTILQNSQGDWPNKCWWLYVTQWCKGKSGIELTLLTSAVIVLSNRSFIGLSSWSHHLACSSEGSAAHHPFSWPACRLEAWGPFAESHLDPNTYRYLNLWVNLSPSLVPCCLVYIQFNSCWYDALQNVGDLDCWEILWLLRCSCSDASLLCFKRFPSVGPQSLGP